MSSEMLHLLAVTPLYIMALFLYIFIFWLVPLFCIRYNAQEKIRNVIITHVAVGFTIWFIWGLVYVVVSAGDTLKDNSTDTITGTQVVEEVQVEE